LSSQAHPGRGRGKSKAALLLAAREYSTAAVMLHNIVADRFGLSVTELKSLDILQRAESVTAGAIARHTHLAPASVTSLIDRLERKGYVRRLRDPGDRRRVIVKLTPNLERTIAPLFEGLSRRILARSKTYSAAQAALIRDFLARTAGDMQDQAEAVAARRRT
jgi:DNA-binding MarR family transcriptional regulator